jgi:hypothetical protein
MARDDGVASSGSPPAITTPDAASPRHATSSTTPVWIRLRALAPHRSAHAVNLAGVTWAVVACEPSSAGNDAGAVEPAGSGDAVAARQRPALARGDMKVSMRR